MRIKSQMLVRCVTSSGPLKTLSSRLRHRSTVHVCICLHALMSLSLRLEFSGDTQNNDSLRKEQLSSGHNMISKYTGMTSETRLKYVKRWNT